MAKEFSIDRKTLGRYVVKYRQNKHCEMSPKYVATQIFTDREEQLLAEYLILSAKLHYGLTSKLTRQFVFEYALSNKKTIPKTWHAANCASYDWLRGFMHRHNTLSLRSPQATSLGRSTNFNETTVKEFFAN